MPNQPELPETTKELLKKFDAADYQRLKKLEAKGRVDYTKMRKAKALTADKVVSFINQLSPWNLKTTGKSILEAYVAEQVKAAHYAAYEKGYHQGAEDTARVLGPKPPLREASGSKGSEDG